MVAGADPRPLAFRTLLNQMYRPAPIAVPLKLEKIVDVPHSAACAAGATGSVAVATTEGSAVGGASWVGTSVGDGPAVAVGASVGSAVGGASSVGTGVGNGGAVAVGASVASAVGGASSVGTGVGNGATVAIGASVG